MRLVHCHWPEDFLFQLNFVLPFLLCNLSLSPSSLSFFLLFLYPHLCARSDCRFSLDTASIVRPSFLFPFPPFHCNVFIIMHLLCCVLMCLQSIKMSSLYLKYAFKSEKESEMQIKNALPPQIARPNFRAPKIASQPSGTRHLELALLGPAIEELCSLGWWCRSFIQSERESGGGGQTKSGVKQEWRHEVASSGALPKVEMTKSGGREGAGDE